MIDQQITQSDVVIGAVLVPGAKAPHLVNQDQVVSHMTEGSVIIDVAVDQGLHRNLPSDDPDGPPSSSVTSCITASPTCRRRPRVHRHPHQHHAELALPLAGKGLEQAIRADAALAKGVNICGACVYEPVSIACDVPFEPLAISVTTPDPLGVALSRCQMRGRSRPTARGAAGAKLSEAGRGIDRALPRRPLDRPARLCGWVAQGVDVVITTAGTGIGAGRRTRGGYALV